MKFLKLISFLTLCGFLSVSCSNKETGVKAGEWEVSVDPASGRFRILKSDSEVMGNLYASYLMDGEMIKTVDYTDRKFSQKPVSDAFGDGIILQVEYTEKALPRLVQQFYVYPEKNYILTDITIESEQDIACNYMSPVSTDSLVRFPESGDNRALFIPFDNDCWIRYRSCPLDFSRLISYEATAIFNNESRKGFIIGSVEHTDWKTAVDMTATGGNTLNSLYCYGGIADSLTRDSKSHGALTGKKIRSPKILLGNFNDWRTGLEEYAKANARIAPPRKWDKAVPFGWNSWGVLQFNLTYQKALEVSDYFKENLQNNHFVNTDGVVYVGLDSGWNSFTEEELADFVKHCKANGQIAGIYWTPFTDWGKQPDRTLKDAPAYQYKDVYLYANGKPQELDGAYAIDPTHPAIEEQMKKISDLFRRTGFEYVKMDFMTHGAMEADKWYNSDIKTGIQAYNYGMQLLDKYFDGMYLNLSISPIFPANYAQSRRIACDAWNKIKDTEYTMNALSYGWWVDHVYQFNDADHIVLREATEGENRARVTSGVITGLYIAGDDFSKGGSAEGKERAKKFLTNPDVNAVAKGTSFYPVEGNGEQSENQFVYQDGDTFYYAIFNYQDQELKTTVSLQRIGLDGAKEYTLKELWSGKEQKAMGNMELTVSPKDVLFFKCMR